MRLALVLALTGGAMSGLALTARTVSAANDPVIAAAGDIACDPTSAYYNGGNGRSNICTAKATAALLNGVDAVLPIGDEQYDCGGLSAFDQSYGASWGLQKAISHPVPGNHEYQASGGTDCSTNGAGYYSYFGSGAGDPARGYYSYNLGAWHIVALNSELCFTSPGCGAGSPEESWLKNDLSSSSASCTLAYWHEPRFASTASGGSTTFAAFWQDLYAAHTDVVLNGHEHWYERFAQQNPAGRADLGGIREFIVGTGGAGLMSLSTRLSTSEASNGTTHGVLKMTLHAGSYDWQFVPITGSTFTDSGSTTCHGAATDTVPPTTTIACNGAACSAGSYAAPVSVSLPATDPGGSGVARTVYTTDGTDPSISGTAITYNAPFSVASSTTVRFFSTDVAGNVEAMQSQSINISGTASYSALVDGRASLLAHWRLGEASGTTARDATGMYSATYAGSPTLGMPGAIANDTDTAVGFNGSTSKVSLPSLPPVGDFSVEGWSYLTNSSTTNNTVFGASGSVRLLARPGSPNTPTTAYAGVWLNGTEYALQPSSTSSNLNAWVHWVLTRQGSTLTLYRNGAQIGQRTDLPAGASANLNGSIGVQGTNYPLTGRIDEVALYRSALSATDVANDYQTALNGQPASPSYKSTVLNDSSLESYWRLGDTGGSAATDSKGTTNGTYSGVTLGAAGAITNDPDTAASFNGSSSKVSLPSLGTVGDFTIEGWTSLTNGSVTNNAIYGSSGAVRLFARPGSPNTPTMGYASVWLNGTEYLLQPNSTASNLNTWVYWALTRQGGTLTLYRNGVQIGQRTDLPTTATATINGSIGAQGGSAYFLNGRIDDVAIYDAALSAAAVANHYTTALNGPAPS